VGATKSNITIFAEKYMKSSSTIFYHEDLYRQIELVPEENYFSVGKFIGDQSAENGSIYGFYNLRVRPEQKVKLLDRKISVTEINDVLGPLSLSYSEDIKTGYGQSIQKAKNTYVWGFEKYGLFIKSQTTLVEAIWLSDSPVFTQLNTSNHLNKALYCVAIRYSLILIDWNKEFICRIRSENDAREYTFQNLPFSQY
jgi:hypothetical protein